LGVLKTSAAFFLQRIGLAKNVIFKDAETSRLSWRSQD
jgi:hypothetical protein